MKTVGKPISVNCYLCFPVINSLLNYTVYCTEFYGVGTQPTQDVYLL